MEALAITPTKAAITPVEFQHNMTTTNKTENMTTQQMTEDANAGAVHDDDQASLPSFEDVAGPLTGQTDRAC